MLVQFADAGTGGCTWLLGYGAVSACVHSVGCATDDGGSTSVDGPAGANVAVGVVMCIDVRPGVGVAAVAGVCLSYSASFA